MDYAICGMSSPCLQENWAPQTITLTSGWYMTPVSNEQVLLNAQMTSIAVSHLQRC